MAGQLPYGKGCFQSTQQARAGGYAVDTQQGDGASRGGGVRRSEPVWARAVGQSRGGWADCYRDCLGCFGWAYRKEEKAGDARRRADRYSRRPHDRKRVLHVFRGGRHGVAVAAGFLFCAGRSDGFSAWVGDACRALWLGSRRDADDLVGTRAGGVALEPRFVCGDEVSLLLLSRIGAGADARSRSAAQRNDRGRARDGSRRRACADVDDGGVLFAARIASAGGGMDVLVRQRSAGERGEADHTGGDVNGREEVKDVQEVYEVEGKNAGVAAFFDLDGTLISLPSLEMRFFSLLRYRRVVGIRNYLAWIAEAARLLPRGINQILHANKMYLRGVRADSGTDIPVCLFTGDQAVETGNSRRQARMPVPLFPEAIERVVWHAERGHLLVIVSGTLEPLAQRAARAMETELEARGLKSLIRVCATRLEVKNGAWTGRIVGEAMFGEAKARTIQRIADAEDLDLQRCFAYGDSANDRWMLEIVGKPAAVNPSNDLARIARRNEWAVLRWRKEKTFTQSAQRSQRTEQSEHELQVARAKAGFRA